MNWMCTNSFTKLSNPDGKIADQRTAIAALTIKVYVLN